MMAHAADSGGSKGNIHAARDARASREPIQGRDAPSRVRHAHDDHGDGECRAQRHSRLSRSGRERGRHRHRRAPSGGFFNVKARDEKEEIGRGTHERMAVDVRRLDARLSAKTKA
jgi:hypothetical protein